ncbi:MAG: type II toxin-antitoxin system PemK/MazF family toxin [Armatimonadetes bacterium]|nr:type II toxin-antitoxin system PemK/MazF family toxin [Armatimonadota bacterium]
MRRGELYRVYKASRADPKRFGVFAVVSRQVPIESSFSTVVCAHVYIAYDGLSTQVAVGTAEGLKRESSVHCDELINIPKAALPDFVGKLGEAKLAALDHALAVAVGIA